MVVKSHLFRKADGQAMEDPKLTDIQIGTGHVICSRPEHRVLLSCSILF